MAVSTKDIKRKISSIQKTQQITRAMKMVAAAKLKKVQDTTIQFRPYMMMLEQVTSALISSARPTEHPLMLFRDIKNVDVVVVTSDRGLCGAFNHNVLKETENFINSKLGGKNVSLTIIGKNAYNYFKFKGIKPKNIYLNILKDKPKHSDAIEIADKLIENYISESTDEVYIVYNSFINVLLQKTKIKRILPVAFEDSVNLENIVERFSFEPSKEYVLDKLLPKYVHINMYSAMLESMTGEYAARMTAMDAATNNANNMINELTLEFNKVRQAAITRELIEITTSIEAMK